MNRLLLTGATGFFGRALLRHWMAAQEPVEVVGLSRSPAAFFERHPAFSGLPWFTLCAGDVARPETLRDLPAFDAVMHLATDSTLGPQRPALDLHDEIVNGTRHVLDLAVERGVKRVLLASSGTVYGPIPEGMRASETFPGAPDPLEARHVYACGKRAAEHLCALYAARFGLEPVIARCFAFLGEDLPLDVHFAAGNFLRDALHGEAIRVAGDGRAVRSYLDQRDLARWLLALLQRGQGGRAYNVGSARAVTIGELAHLVGGILAPGKPVRIEGAPSAAPASWYVPDVDRAQRELGLAVTIDLEQAIRDTGAALLRKPTP